MALSDTQPAIEATTATIGVGASLSPAVDIGGGSLQAIQMPAAWTAAAITFQVSVDGVTYQNMYDAAGTEKSISVAASRFVILSTYDFRGVRYLKVRSGTNGAPVNQTGGAAVQLVVRQGA